MAIHFNINSSIDPVGSYSRSNNLRQSADTTNVQETPSADRDKLSLHSKDSVPDDESFAALLARKTAESVRQGVSAERTAELHDLVQTGRYRVDAERAAAHILGYF